MGMTTTRARTTPVMRRSIDDTIRDCHAEGHHWEGMAREWTVADERTPGEHLRKEQRCLRDGTGCGSIRVMRMTRYTRRPLGKPYIVYPTDGQGRNLYRYPSRMTRWELRAEEASGK